MLLWGVVPPPHGCRQRVCVWQPAGVCAELRWLARGAGGGFGCGGGGGGLSGTGWGVGGGGGDLLHVGRVVLLPWPSRLGLLACWWWWWCVIIMILGCELRAITIITIITMRSLDPAVRHPTLPPLYPPTAPPRHPSLPASTSAACHAPQLNAINNCKQPLQQVEKDLLREAPQAQKVTLRYAIRSRPCGWVWVCGQGRRRGGGEVRVRCTHGNPSTGRSTGRQHGAHAAPAPAPAAASGGGGGGAAGRQAVMGDGWQVRGKCPLKPASAPRRSSPLAMSSARATLPMLVCMTQVATPPCPPPLAVWPPRRASPLPPLPPPPPHPPCGASLLPLLLPPPPPQVLQRAPGCVRRGLLQGRRAPQLCVRALPRLLAQQHPPRAALPHPGEGRWWAAGGPHWCARVPASSNSGRA